MKSNDEEYLDSLLSSARNSNNNNPMSALSRMSGRGSASGSPKMNGSGDLGALVDNSNGNEDLNDIGSILDRLDRDELVDDSMSDLLDSIGRPTDPRIPKFTIGGNPSSEDVRDPEEIALDEAIADAERMEAEMLAGKFDNVPSYDSDENIELGDLRPPIVDIEEGDDALLEMAPEVSLPEDNQGAGEGEAFSDAKETPEQILNDLLDDMSDGDLMQQDEGSAEESLRDALDNMKDDFDEAESVTGQGDSTLSLEETFEGAVQEIAAPDEATAESLGDDADLDDISLEDLEASLDGVIDDEPLDSEGSAEPMPENAEIPSNAGEVPDASGQGGEDGTSGDMGLEDMEAALDDLGLDGFTLDGGSEEGESLDAAVAGASEEPESAGVDEEDLGESVAEVQAEEAPSAAVGEEDFNLNDLEASLDDLLNTDVSDNSSTEGEVAEVASADESSDIGPGEQEEVSIQDLDALMNSLANDEIEDIENTIDKDIESGHADESEIPKEDILSALTEDGFDDLGDPEISLDELASIPERPSRKSSGGGAAPEEDEAEGGKKKKKKGFFARLFAALVKEDEETEGELASLTAENQQVLDELGEEGGKGKKKKQKKEKKEKKPKEKKPKKEKPPKEKKPPKPKKEKKPKPPKDPGEPEKAISPKKVALSGIFAASLGILIIIPSLILPDMITSKSANAAYSHREYTTAYKLLYGKTLNEDESLMYEQSRVLAWAQRYLDGYKNYSAMNMKEEALDMLLMAIRNQEDLIAEAQKYNVEIEVNSVYDSIISVLSETYGLTEADIAEINSIKKDRDYTIRLMEVVGTL